MSIELPPRYLVAVNAMDLGKLQFIALKMGDLPRFDGILGEDVLRSFASLRIDYQKHVVELEGNEKAGICSCAFLRSRKRSPMLPSRKLTERFSLLAFPCLPPARQQTPSPRGNCLTAVAWENNRIFGRHPSPAKQSLINPGIFGAQAGAFYLTEHSRHATVRWTGRALLGHVILEHSRLAACNAGVDTRSPAIQNCGPLMPF